MSQISPQKPSVASPHSVKGNLIQSRLPWLYAFWKFSRPHTIIGTTLSVLGIYLIVLAGNSDTLFAFRVDRFLLPLVACLCGNVYIVGLNQIQDVEIDRVNKPHLPLASGEFSRREAWTIVLTTGVLAIALAASGSPYLLAMVGISLLIGTAYSLPPLRLKRFSFWASFCIFTVRGIVVNLGLFLHFQNVLGDKTGISAIVWALTLFILGFTFAIAIFKDIPDLEGDRRYHISTFTVRLGQQAVFNLARWVLTFCYVGIAIAGLFIPNINAPFLIITHLIALGACWFLSLKVNVKNKSEVARFYQFIWKLFYLEYLILPIACLLG